MNNTLIKFKTFTIPTLFIISACFYIFIIIRPELIFHHQQPGLILNKIYYLPYLKYPGGVAELLANLVLQSFYYRISGTLVLFVFFILIWWLTLRIIDLVHKSELNQYYALIPSLLTITFTSNYNFPFSVIVSYTIVLLLLLILSKGSNGLFGSLLLFTFGAIGVYWITGSGYIMLYSASALFVLTQLKKWPKTIYIFYVILFTWLFPLIVSGYLVAIAPKYRYLWLYSPKAWFMKYEPSIVFILFLISVPLILILSKLISILNNQRQPAEPKLYLKILKHFVALLIASISAIAGHLFNFSSDGRKIAEADYFCYHNKAKETAKSATTLKNYNFAANLNYNLVMSKTDQLTDKFFSFFQIKGTEALHPDIDFASELSFIASDFYYEIGLISEARHWAYESLVFYPYSVRAMQNLVKIHLVTGEYKAAERTLKTIQKGLTGKGFVREYLPYISDTSLIKTNPELMEKRSFIPAPKELNTAIDGRFRELLEANCKNKKAYEYLMLFYLLKDEHDNFDELFKKSGEYFQTTPVIYEEALLMHASRNGTPLPPEINISNETQNRFNGFMQKVDQFKGKTRLARNTLYAEYGKTYMYFLQFVYPNIIDTEITNEEDDYPAI